MLYTRPNEPSTFTSLLLFPHPIPPLIHSHLDTLRVLQPPQSAVPYHFPHFIQPCLYLYSLVHTTRCLISTLHLSSRIDCHTNYSHLFRAMDYFLLNHAWNTSYSPASLLSCKAHSNHWYLVTVFGLEITSSCIHHCTEIFLAHSTSVLVSPRLEGGFTPLNVTFCQVFLMGRSGRVFTCQTPPLHGAGGGYVSCNPHPTPVRGPPALIPWTGPRLLPPIFNRDPSRVWVGRVPERGQGQGMPKKAAPPRPLSGAGRGKGQGRRVFRVPVRPVTNSTSARLFIHKLG